MDVPFLSCFTLLPDPSFLGKGAYLVHRPAHGQHLTNRAKQVSTDQSPPGRWVLTNHHQAGRFCSATIRQVCADQPLPCRQVLTNPQPDILTSHQHRWILPTLVRRGHQKQQGQHSDVPVAQVVSEGGPGPMFRN